MLLNVYPMHHRCMVTILISVRTIIDRGRYSTIHHESFCYFSCSDLAYSSGLLDLHTDNCYFVEPPGQQRNHMITCGPKVEYCVKTYTTN